MKKKSAILLCLIISALSNLYAQNFTRVIQLQRSRMNGADVTKVQRRLLALGFKKTGAVDGWYGPLTEGSVKTIQCYTGFSQDGRITKAFWDMLFDSKKDGLLINISIIANYIQDSFMVTKKRNGSNFDFDEFLISTQNKEVRTVLFQHVNNGLIICRFRLWYLADAIFMIQDIYYGDYRTHIYLKTAGDFFELKNGIQNPADSALEGIIKRTNEGIESADFAVPQLISAIIPANQAAAPAQQSTSAPAAAASASTPAAQNQGAAPTAKPEGTNE